MISGGADDREEIAQTEEERPYVVRTEDILGPRDVLEVRRMVEMKPLRIRMNVWTRLTLALGAMDEFFREVDKRPFVEHTLAMMEGGPNFDVRPEHSWTFPDGYHKQGDFYVFSRNGVDFGVVMMEYSISEAEGIPYCLIDHVQGILQDEFDFDAVFGCNVLEGMGSYVIRKSKVLIDDGWKVALKVDPSPVGKREERGTAFSMGVRDRFFEPRPQMVEQLRSTRLPEFPFDVGVYELNPRRQRVKQILYT